MTDEELKAKIMEWFRENTKKAKKKYYMKDVCKGLPDLPRKEVKKAITELVTAEQLTYFSLGSTTMVCLPEHFHENV